MIRLRHMARLAPSTKEIGKLKPDDEVTFAPMDALADGLGGLDLAVTKPLGEVMAGSYNYFREGDVLLAKVTPCFENGKKARAQGLTNGIGFATSEVHVIRADGRKLDARYLTYLLSSEDFRANGMRSMTGAGGLRRISDQAILNYRPHVTDLSTQRQIADLLDRETARIDLLIEKKQRLGSIFGPRLEALVASALLDENLPLMRFDFLAQRMIRPVDLGSGDNFVRLGLFNHGRGIFKEPEADEEGMGDSDFFFVEEDDLIISGQFAWEGAVALASSAEGGCVVSHRYPVYRGRLVDTAFLLAVLRSSFGDFLLNDASRGSAGRNRPLNTWRLGKEKLPVPPQELQTEVRKTVTMEAELRRRLAASIDRLREYRSAFITAAVTGQIDPATWLRSGEGDRRLEIIQEAMLA